MKQAGKSHVELFEERRAKRIAELRLRIIKGLNASGWSPSQLTAVYKRVVKLKAKPLLSSGAGEDAGDGHD